MSTLEALSGTRILEEKNNLVSRVRIFGNLVWLVQNIYQMLMKLLLQQIGQE